MKYSFSSHVNVRQKKHFQRLRRDAQNGLMNRLAEDMRKRERRKSCYAARPDAGVKLRFMAQPGSSNNITTIGP